jgi:hypothetical protein
MNKASQSTLIGSKSIATRAGTILLGLMLAAGTSTTALAQGEIASGTISGTGSGPYNYSLTFSNAAGSLSPVGSVWYSWVPGFTYLPGVPTMASAPSGWTESIQGDSIQFVASSSANDIAAGHSLSGFGYQANFSPAQLAAAPNAALSVAYSAGLFSDAGDTFTVQTVPEPSTLTLLVAGLTAFFLAGWRKLRVV